MVVGLGEEGALFGFELPVEFDARQRRPAAQTETSADEVVPVERHRQQYRRTDQCIPDRQRVLSRFAPVDLATSGNLKKRVSTGST